MEEETYLGALQPRGINSPNPQLREGPLVWFWLAQLPAPTISKPKYSFSAGKLSLILAALCTLLFKSVPAGKQKPRTQRDVSGWRPP